MNEEFKLVGLLILIIVTIVTGVIVTGIIVTSKSTKEVLKWD